MGSVIDLLKIARKIHVVTLETTADAILLDKLKGRPNLTMMVGYKVTAILGPDKVTGVKVSRADGSDEKELALDGVFIEIGLVPNTELVEGLLALNEKKEIAVDCNSNTSVMGVFAAGDVTSVPHEQIVVAAGEGAKAALSATDYLRRRKKG